MSRLFLGKPYPSLVVVWLGVALVAAVALVGIRGFTGSRPVQTFRFESSPVGLISTLASTSRGEIPRSVGVDPALALSVEVVSWRLATKTVELLVSCEIDTSRIEPEQQQLFLGEGIPVRVDGYAAAQTVLLKRSSAVALRPGYSACLKQPASGLTYGNPAAYPFDHYNSAIGFVPPEGITTEVTVATAASWSDPFTLAVADIGSLAAFNGQPDELAPFLLTAQRLRTSSLFALLVAATPLLLLFVAVAELRASFDGRHGGNTLARLPLEMGAAFLALLTLRQVLVPGVIDAPTVIDLILAMELTLFVLALILAWRYRTLSNEEPSQLRPQP